MLNGIAFALFIGIVVGTYSSIFVASALLVMWHEQQGVRKTTEGHGLVVSCPVRAIALKDASWLQSVSPASH